MQYSNNSTIAMSPLASDCRQEGGRGEGALREQGQGVQLKMRREQEGEGQGVWQWRRREGAGEELW